MWYLKFHKVEISFLSKQMKLTEQVFFFFLIFRVNAPPSEEEVDEIDKHAKLIGQLK